MCSSQAGVIRELRAYAISKRWSDDGGMSRVAMEGIRMGLIPSINDWKVSVEESYELLRRAVTALEKLAAEQERTNDLYAEVNEAGLAEPRNASRL
ncbi:MULTISPECIES: hypothetical protein [Mycolicibacterium]|jgi:hypothetical protein|uniref:Uncharacterized protein n=2 Tax=Mycolicibacterium TaxID=1866885 RepID=A0A9X3BML6_9MYCO|nr:MULTISPECIES: hypothetical protein [Mycolicibacterium]MCV7170534.1 hypothetical protein [[Mycobacterium] manitobense]MDO3637754.1 hypothetical protein [Mycolicibacterium arseniciresistens]